MAQAPGGISLIPIGQTLNWEQARGTLQTDLDTLTTQFNALAGIVTQIQNAGVNIQTNPNTVSNAPILRAYGRITNQVAAASVVSYVNGNQDSSYLISAYVFINSGTSFHFGVQVAFFPEANVPSSNSTDFSFSQAGLLIGSGISDTLGLGPYCGLSMQIRSKANTTFNITTVALGGHNFSAVNYNVESTVIQIH